MLGSDPINVAVATTGSRDSRGSRCSRFGSDPINLAEQQAAMWHDEPEAAAEPLERPSWEALTDAFVPGSMPGRVRAIEVDQQGIVTGFFLIMDVAGREALVECSVRLATYTRRGQNGNTQQQEEQREHRRRRRRRRQNRNRQQQEPPPAAAAAAEAVQQPGRRLATGSRDAPPDEFDWESDSIDYDEDAEITGLHRSRTP